MDFEFDTDEAEYETRVTPPQTQGRKPRIALMGEFSAGKSTLSNLLIGSNPLPTKVTATQLPPVWISRGEDAPFFQDLDGQDHPVSLEDLDEIDPADTLLVRLFATSDILELCDIIDMPGISDPNMASEVWERVIGKADAVIWCTHATQAWRQSEAAVWEEIGEDLFEKSLLLITRFDKLLTEVDRKRVVKRLERETEGLFADRLPISLTEAIAAGDDKEQWVQSGAEAFIQRFVDLVHELSKSLGTPQATEFEMDRDGQHTGHAKPILQVGSSAIERETAPARVMPSRIRPTSVRATPRPVE